MRQTATERFCRQDSGCFTFRKTARSYNQNPFVMPTVTLRPLFHWGEETIAIEFPQVRDLEVAIRKLKGTLPHRGSRRGPDANK